METKEVYLNQIFSTILKWRSDIFVVTVVILVPAVCYVLLLFIKPQTKLLHIHILASQGHRMPIYKRINITIATAKYLYKNKQKIV